MHNVTQSRRDGHVLALSDITSHCERVRSRRMKCIVGFVAGSNRLKRLITTRRRQWPPLQLLTR